MTMTTNEILLQITKILFFYLYIPFSIANKVAERAEAIYWSFSGNYTFLINLKLANPGVITIQLLYSVIKCPLVLTRRGLYVQCLSLLVFSQSCGWQIDNRLHLSFLN